MKPGILTPLGEICIYIDNVRSEYEFESYCPNIRSLREKPPTRSYRITVLRKDWQRIRCEVSLYDAEIPCSSESGERYVCAEFVKDQTVLTIGAGDGLDAFDTNPVRYGIEYVRKSTADKVMFGVAWAEDYEGRFDIRTQLATDVY